MPEGKARRGKARQGLKRKLKKNGKLHYIPAYNRNSIHYLSNIKGTR